MLEENRAATADVVRRSGADVGLAWDGDYDRCFFFDESGQFIEGYYLVGLLAEVFLKQEPGARIVHDPRLTWNTLDIVQRHGGAPVLCKSGHAFIKQKMREVDAAYGGEMSAHHYFRSFSYCDSGMIPWLLVLGVISARGQPLSALVGERMRLFPASGEINRRLDDRRQGDPGAGARALRAAGQAPSTSPTGCRWSSTQWRFNLRGSNTEPLVRLNVESRGNEALMQREDRRAAGADRRVRRLGGTGVQDPRCRTLWRLSLEWSCAQRRLATCGESRSARRAHPDLQDSRSGSYCGAAVVILAVQRRRGRDQRRGACRPRCSSGRQIDCRH